MRADFFGPQGDTRWNLQRLQQAFPSFHHHELDIRHRAEVIDRLRQLRPNAVVHTAAQPRHDLAASRSFDDFDVNAVGTFNIQEAARLACPESPFVHMSTNKVSGDAPNEIRLNELPTRRDYSDRNYAEGVPETFRMDQCKHSIFGASKVAADVMVQEYGRYFNMPTGALRGGCLTGPNHSGVELHGFLSCLIKCNLEGRTCRVFGCQGKQVRDNVHSHHVVRFMERLIARPCCGEVYNIGGGRANSISILEAFALISDISGQPMKHEYVDQNRSGDHICYLSNLARMKSHYPGREITRDLRTTFEEIHAAWVSGH